MEGCLYFHFFMKNGGILCLWRARRCCRSEGFGVRKKFIEKKKKITKL